MLNSYYYARYRNDYFIYIIEPKDKGITMTLLRNDQLVDETIGTAGQYTLQGQDLKVDIEHKITKSSQQLFFEGNPMELKKISKRKLKAVLRDARIHNVVNPSKETIRAQSFVYRKLIIPIFLILTGFILHVLLLEKARTYLLISIIPQAIAGSMIYDALILRMSWMKDIKKLRIGFILLIFIATTILIEYLFK